MILSVPNCTCTIQHLIAATLANSRGVAPADVLADLASCDDLRSGDVALDSLDQLSVARRVAEFYELETAGIEEILLRRTRLSQWSNDIVECLNDATLTQFWFRSGGTTGEPRLIPHAVPRLLAEIRDISALLSGTRRIVALVPLHHIYGFIWGPLLGSHLNVPVLHGPDAVSVTHRGLEPGDLVLGVPEWWQYFGRSRREIPQGVTGVTSTAPCPPPVIRAASNKGLTSMVEAYGSSETAGIGWRDDPASGFQLFGHWRKHDDDHLQSAAGTVHPLPDVVDWESERSLIPRERRDHAVQVGGTNVWPERVRAFIEEHPQVEVCAVRAFDAGDGTRLKAFIVPAATVSEDLQAQIRGWLRSGLSTAERPTRLTFGNELPRNSMGKLCDW